MFLHVYTYGEFLGDWCLKVVSRHIHVTGLNSEFFFSSTSCHTNVKELSLFYHLSIAEGRTVGFITFSRIIILCEMQTLSRIWTLVILSISYNNNHYHMHLPPLDKIQNLIEMLIFHVQKNTFNCNLIYIMQKECMTMKPLLSPVMASIIHEILWGNHLKHIIGWLVSLFNGISTLFRLFNAKAILLEEQ